MKVQDLMKKDVDSCGRNTDLAAAAMIMWRKDCGVVPVVGNEGEAVGMITDRDICMAVATRHLRPEEIAVSEVMSDKVYKVRPGDDIRAALEAMRSERVRRLPVVSPDGVLQGIISINDIVLAAGRSTGGKRPDILAEDVLEVLKSICEHDGMYDGPPKPGRKRLPAHA
jgi:CBS domain-containing protein